jgi:hypothetical protein
MCKPDRTDETPIAEPPCLGCIYEDLADADERLERLETEHLAAWRTLAERSGRNKLTKDHTEEELQRRRATARARWDELVAAARSAAKNGGRTTRASCHECLSRKLDREFITSLAQRVYIDSNYAHGVITVILRRRPGNPNRPPKAPTSGNGSTARSRRQKTDGQSR